jgi:pSer/pThr/pTyr-binding forkhead associated (FHA) protein
MVNRTHLMSTRMEPVAWLVLAAPRRPADAWRLAPETTVGRAPGQNDITVDDETASGRHLRIRHEEGQFVLYDLGSRNGTQVNGQRVERQVLMDEDIIVVGETPFIFKMVQGRKLNLAR